MAWNENNDEMIDEEMRRGNVLFWNIIYKYYFYEMKESNESNIIYRWQLFYICNVMRNNNIY